MRERIVKVEQTVNFDNPILLIFSRDESGKKNLYKKSGIDSYFYSATDPRLDPGWRYENNDRIREIKEEGTSVFGKKLWKVITKLPKDTYNARKGLPHFEADITWTQRALIDLGLKDGFEYNKTTRKFIPCDARDVKLRWCVIDIEVMNDPDIRPTWKNPSFPICCIVVWDSFTNTTSYFSMKDCSEREMFNKFIQYIWKTDPDIITGWNVYFDVSYIIGRMANIGMEEGSLSPVKKAYCYEKRDEAGQIMYEIVEIQGRIIFDSMDAYKVYKNPSGMMSSYNLKEIARKELNVTWEDYGAKIKEVWNKNPLDVIRYCIKDVTYERDIIKRNNIIEIYSSIAAISGCPMSNTTSKGQITDHYLLRIRGNKVLPSKARQRNTRIKQEAKGTDEEFKGAIVLTPPPGIHKDVGVFDASGLYPSIIIGFNISLETKLSKHDSEQMRLTGELKYDPIKIEDERGNVWYYKNPKDQVGLIPQICLDFKNLRKESKKELKEAKEKYGPETPQWYLAHYKDVAIKTITNGVFGVIGEPGFRLFDLDCANSITAVGRKTTSILAEECTKQGMQTVYGDTDSIFINVGSYENAINAKKFIDDFMKNKLEEWGVDKEAIEIGFEKFFKSILFKRRKISKNRYAPVKKKYVGHMTYYEDKPCDELYIRGFELRRSDQSDVLHRVMMNFFRTAFQKGDVEGAIQLIKDENKKFKNYSAYDVSIPRAVHTEGANSPWVRGAQYAKEHLKFQFDSETAPRLIYLKRVAAPYPPTDVICIQRGHELPKEFEIDYDVMFEKIIRKKMEFIMNELGYSWIHVIDGISKLDDFFGDQNEDL